MKNPSLRETTWGDLVKVKQGKYVAPSELSPDRTPTSPIPTVGANGVLGFVAKSSYRYRVPLVTCRGSNCGLIQYPKEPVWVSNNAMGLDAGSQEDNDFIYYLALATDFSDIVTGSAQPQITAGPLKTKRVSIPDHTHWGGIAATLGALDDKIQSNSRAQWLMEQLVRTEFDRWFSAVHDPTGTAISDLISVNPRRSLARDLLATYVGMTSLPEHSAVISEWETKEFGSGQKFANGDVLMARITPCLENGKTAVVDMLRDDEVGWGSTEYVVLAPQGQISTPWIYCLVRSEPVRSFAIRSMTGTSGRQRFQASAFDTYRVAAPTESELRAFNEIATPLFERMTLLRDENRVLASMRDLLLPELISGRIRIPMAPEVVS